MSPLGWPYDAAISPAHHRQRRVAAREAAAATPPAHTAFTEERPSPFWVPPHPPPQCSWTESPCPVFTPTPSVPRPRPCLSPAPPLYGTEAGAPRVGVPGIGSLCSALRLPRRGGCGQGRVLIGTAPSHLPALLPGSLCPGSPFGFRLPPSSPSPRCPSLLSSESPAPSPGRKQGPKERLMVE